MKILILGATGMLGHRLYQTLRPRFDTYATIRGDVQGAPPFFDSDRLIGETDATRIETVERAISTLKPQAVVNAIGVVKQVVDTHGPVSCVQINSLFPHQLSEVCANHGTRLIHVSTDCVFSGKKGAYKEEDLADADDLYGRSKLLGEVIGAHALTLRTSFIGYELGRATGLLE